MPTEGQHIVGDDRVTMGGSEPVVETPTRRPQRGHRLAARPPHVEGAEEPAQATREETEAEKKMATIDLLQTLQRRGDLWRMI